MHKPFLILSTILFLVSCMGDFKSPDIQDDSFKLSSESDLLITSYAEEIENFYDSGEEGVFYGIDSIAIYYKKFEQKASKNAILISSGRTEAAIKYKELIFDLYRNGYSVFINDHRGQGLSGRMTDDPDMGYVRDFQNYIDDMKLFYDDHVAPKNYTNKFLLAHSMGGAIGMTFLEQYPEAFDATAFSSPMLGLKPPLCSIVTFFNKEQPRYAIGQHKYNDDYSSFENNALTSSNIRFQNMVKAYAEVPKARLGGVTYTWIHESCDQFGYMFENIDAIQTPFILFSAEDESIVSTYAHVNFIKEAKALGKNCEAYDILDGRHELFIEKDKQRNETLNITLKFFESNKKTSSLN